MRSSLRRTLIAGALVTAACSIGWIAPQMVPAAAQSEARETMPMLATPPSGSAAEVRLGNAFKQSSAYESPNYDFRVNHGGPWLVHDVFSTEDAEGDPFDSLSLWNGTTHAEFLGETWPEGTQAPDCADFWSQAYAEQETTDNFTVLESGGGSDSTWSRFSWDQTRADGSIEPVTMLVGCHVLASGDGEILNMLVSSASADWERDANARYDLFSGVCWIAPNGAGDGIERCAGG